MGQTPLHIVEKVAIRCSKRALIVGMCIFIGLIWNPIISPIFPSRAEVKSQGLLTSSNIRKGLLVVADPSLSDPSFRETVVLICEHSQEGTIGVIINRPTNIPLKDVFPDISGLQVLSHTLFEGGPVQRRGLLMLFRSKNPSENIQSVTDGVYWGGDPGMVASMVENPKPGEFFRVFAGYAGWGYGQLAAEIKGRFWRTVPGNAETIFETDPTKLWKELIEKSKHPRLLVSYPSSQKS